MLPVSTTLPRHRSTLMYSADEVGFYLVTFLVGCAYAIAHIVILLGSVV